jgi:hypothetical protein
MPVPDSSNRSGLPLSPTLEEPLAAALIGVTANDDQLYTPDHRGDRKRFGNESSMGGPATVFRVLREPPGPPAAAGTSGRVWASRADYHGHSYFTYRWSPAPYLKAFTYRALDDAIFQADLARRPRTQPLAATHLQFFPDEDAEPGWNEARRILVADELNALDQLDKKDKAAVAAAYGGLSDDALRVLAALPGTERVFVQLTPQALDPDEPDARAPNGLRWRRLGPDAPAGMLAANERAYIDTLDGKARNRYFYRCAYVNEVHTVGSLSLSSPPVWLPDVTPPVAPRITKVSAGDCQIALEWSRNREPDLAEYRVFRTFDLNRSRDIRLMDLVHTLPADDPVAQNPFISWTDNPVPGLRDIWYRIVAVDRVDPDPKGGGGNISAPSPAIRTRAFDLTPPPPPAIASLAWVRVDPQGAIHALSDAVPVGTEWVMSVQLTWAAPTDMKFLVQVKGDSDADFSSASGWLPPGTTSYLHANTRTFETHTYRLKVISGAGNTNVVYNELELAAVT